MRKYIRQWIEDDDAETPLYNETVAAYHWSMLVVLPADAIKREHLTGLARLASKLDRETYQTALAERPLTAILLFNILNRIVLGRIAESEGQSSTTRCRSKPAP